MAQGELRKNYGRFLTRRICSTWRKEIRGNNIRGTIIQGNNVRGNKVRGNQIRPPSKQEAIHNKILFQVFKHLNQPK